MISEDSIRKDRHWHQFIKTVLAESPRSGIGENAIYQKYKELYDLYEFSPAGYLRLDKNSRIMSANLTTAFMLGAYRSELIGKPLYAFVKLNDRDTLYLHLRRLFKEKQPQSCELQIKGFHGKLQWVRLGSLYGEDAHQRPESRTTLLDIDEQKQIQSELENLAAIVRFSEDAMIRKSVDGIITHWNPAAERIFGYSAAEAMGRHIKLIIPQERLEENHELVRRVLGGEQIKAWETVRCTKDGRTIDIALSLAAIRDDGGEITALAGIERDISERVMTRLRLNRTREELQMATEAARIGTWFLDFSQGTAQWNAELYRMLGLDPRPGPENIEFFFNFIHPDDRRGRLKNNRTLIDKGGSELVDEFRIIRKDGQIRWLAVRGRMISNTSDEPVQMAGVNFDITDIKRAREAEQLAQMQLAAKVAQLEQKNQELDQFAYAASHDLKAPMRAIRNYSDFLYEDLAESLSGEQKQYLEGLKTAASQGQQLIDDLLGYSRIGRVPVKTEKVDVRAMINEVKSFLNLQSDIDLSVQNDWPLLEADPLLLTQILKNLVANAVKFNTSAFKRVSIGWRQSDKNGCIELFVRDNGIGIDPQYQQQIFRIFQRLHTGREYEGTGIGLAVVKKAALELGGMVRVESTPGEGSTFFVELPVKVET
jgi:PAS domain S-box-containing protein